MDNDTRLRIERTPFEKLHRQLRRTHKAGRPSMSRAHLLQLGRIVVRFQRLEMSLARLLETLLGLDQMTGDILASRLSFGALADLFATIATQRASDLKEVFVLRQALEDAEVIRNRLIHSVWAAGASPGTPAVRIKKAARPRKGLVVDTEHLSTTDLRKIAAWLGRVDMAIEGFRFLLFEGAVVKENHTSSLTGH